VTRLTKRRIADYYPYRSLRELNALKRDAARAVKQAICEDRLTSHPCEVCGLKRSEAHHDDYAKPLDVRWLCRHHHRKRDAELREMRRAAAKHASALPVAYLKRQARLQPVPFAAPATTRNHRRSLLTNDYTLALVVQATQALSDLMDAHGVSESSLARRMKISHQMVNVQFAGGFRTLKILAAYATAIGYEASIVFRKRDELEQAS
jgi:hypothetical protein